MGWSPHSFWCNNTCWNQHFSIPVGISRYMNFTTPCMSLGPPFEKLYYHISFFDGSLTQAKVCHIFSRCSLRHYMNMFPILCRSSHRCLVISSPYQICILFVLGSFIHNVMYPPWFATSNNCTSFMLSMWTYHWWFNYPFVSMLMWEWTRNNPKYSSKYRHNYYCRKWNTYRERFPTFFPTTFKDKLIFLSLEITFKPLWTLSYLIWFTWIWNCVHYPWQCMQW